MESCFHFKLLLQELHLGHCHQIIKGKQHAWQMGGTLPTMETIGSICGENHGALSQVSNSINWSHKKSKDGVIT